MMSLRMLNTKILILMKMLVKKMTLRTKNLKRKARKLKNKGKRKKRIIFPPITQFNYEFRLNIYLLFKVIGSKTLLGFSS